MFVRDYAEIARHLTDLTRKETRSVANAWSEREQKCFDFLKAKLAQAPMLMFPRFDQPFYLKTDASNSQLGAVLIRKEGDVSRVVGYFSRKLSRAEENYHTTEKECLAVVWSVTECCRPYLHGSTFTVIAHHEALRWLLNLKEPRGRLARWTLKQVSYDFEIVTRAGRIHSFPDALSRLPPRDDAINFTRTLPVSDRSMPISKLAPVEDHSGYELPAEEEFKTL